MCVTATFTLRKYLFDYIHTSKGSSTSVRSTAWYTYNLAGRCHWQGPRTVARQHALTAYHRVATTHPRALAPGMAGHQLRHATLCHSATANAVSFVPVACMLLLWGAPLDARESAASSRRTVTSRSILVRLLGRRRVRSAELVHSDGKGTDYACRAKSSDRVEQDAVVGDVHLLEHAHEQQDMETDEECC